MSHPQNSSEPARCPRGIFSVFPPLHPSQLQELERRGERRERWSSCQSGAGDLGHSLSPLATFYRTTDTDFSAYTGTQHTDFSNITNTTQLREKLKTFLTRSLLFKLFDWNKIFNNCGPLLRTGFEGRKLMVVVVSCVWLVVSRPQSCFTTLGLWPIFLCTLFSLI